MDTRVQNNIQHIQKGIMKNERQLLERKIRILILIFFIGLIVSGITAFPLEWELEILNSWASNLNENNGIRHWIEKVNEGVRETNLKYPFMAYGTDWLAFAHIVIGISFWGPLRDPVRNIWIIEFGMIACILIIPLALIAGPMRGIPFYWRLIDCSFGIFGIIPLLFTHRLISKLKIIKEDIK
jgi:hypothetical protein